MGKFGKDNFDKGNAWRSYCKTVLEDCECDYIVKAINPNDYFNFLDTPPKYQSQKEIMELDLLKVRRSDLIIVNFNDKWSLGSMSEMAIAYEKRIPIIGLNIYGEKLHPWQIEMCARIFNDIDEMIQYVKDYYLN